MLSRRLGPFTVSAIGLGCMPMSLSYGDIPTERQAVATIHAALDAGITYIDTADIYAPTWDTMGHNERIVAKALKSYAGDTDGVIIGTKAGITRGPGGSGHHNENWSEDSSVTYLRSAVEKSLRALQVEAVDLLYWHRPDPLRDYGDGVEAFAQLRQEGKVRSIGISNADISQIDIAVQMLGPDGLAAVQDEHSPGARDSERELERCRQVRTTFVAYAPFGGSGPAASVGDRFPAFAAIAADRGVSPQQVVLAWQLSLGEHVLPIPGATRPETIMDSARAADLQLTDEELARCSTTGGRP